MIPKPISLLIFFASFALIARSDTPLDALFHPIAGESIPLSRFSSHQPIFIIEAPNEAAAPEAMRLATLVESLSQPSGPAKWILNLNFDPTPITQRFLDRFSEKHQQQIGQLQRSVIPKQLRIELVSPSGKTLWSSVGHPNSKQWAIAVEIHRKAKKEP